MDGQRGCRVGYATEGLVTHHSIGDYLLAPVLPCGSFEESLNELQLLFRGGSDPIDCDVVWW